MGFVGGFGGFFFVVEGKFFSLLIDLEVISTSIWGCHNQSRFGIKRCVSWGSKDQLQGQGGVDGFDAASHGPCGLKWKISGHCGVATLGAQWLYCMVIFQQRVSVFSQRKTQINQVMWCQCVKFRCIHAAKGPGRKQRDMHSAWIRKREDQHVYWFATPGRCKTF